MSRKQFIRSVNEFRHLKKSVEQSQTPYVAALGQETTTVMILEEQSDEGLHIFWTHYFMVESHCSKF